MANKCVELQLELNEQRALVETLSNRPGTFQKKKLAQDLISIAKERDRMMHNAKAATWKLQEVRMMQLQFVFATCTSQRHLLVASCHKQAVV